MPLTDVEIRTAIPGPKMTKMFDGRGLLMQLMPNGSRRWRFKYRFGGKEQGLSFGTYPTVTLKAARAKTEEARLQLAAGINPSQLRKTRKLANVENAENSFEAIAREWFAKNAPTWAESHSSKIIVRLEQDIFPWIGNRPIRDITPPELLGALRRIEDRGAIETAHRVMQNCGQIYRYAIATGRAERDAAADLRGALSPVKVKGHAAIKNPKQVGELLRAIAGYHGAFVTRCAFQLAPMVFVRPVELRAAEWSEVDLDAAEWRVVASRMKKRRHHIVPLATQAVAILRELHALTGHGRFVFPGARSKDRPMSENTINAALRRLGYSKDDMTGHGFRSTASTLLNELSWNGDAIERQLAHIEGNEARGTYNSAEHLPERRKMMQAWADYLTSLMNGAEIVHLHRAA